METFSEVSSKKSKKGRENFLFTNRGSWITFCFSAKTCKDAQVLAENTV